MFKLHPNLTTKEYVTDLNLCRVLMENNREFPWIFLVPKRENIHNMADLAFEDRLTLMREIDVCEKAMIRLFKPDQTNVAMIGNVTPQLHVHIICRFQTDSFWPDTIWGRPGEKMTPAETNRRKLLIQQEILK